MPVLSTAAPARRPELLLSPLGNDGQHVVKDPRAGAYFRLGEQESFLLQQLDGTRTTEEIRTAFEGRFQQPLSDEDWQEFLELAHARGLLQSGDAASTALEISIGTPATDVAASRNGSGTGAHSLKPHAAPAPSVSSAPPRTRQSILFWRRRLFDPDSLLTWLEPKLWFLWTRGFLVGSAGGILLAMLIFWANRHEVVSHFVYAFRWETVVLAWLVLLLATACHEFAHGLTCKHYGREVHEIGFLLIFLMPALYCNVSDAWLLKEKSKRLAVTLAGGYCDLCFWALAVMVGRLSMPDSLVNYLAWVAMCVLGARVFFNFNPLLKLDGYYLLSDWLEIPNLRQRSVGRVAGYLRSLLWGAPRPAAEVHGKFLLGFGLVTWLFSFTFLSLMIWGLAHFLGTRWGFLGYGLTAFVGFVAMRGLFQGLSNGEVGNMMKTRRKRAALWLLGLGGLAIVLSYVEMDDRASGTFRLRPAIRAELRAPIAGFLKAVYFDEGDRVSPAALVARLEVPDLDSRIAQEQAEVREAGAKLRMLEAGPRPEEIVEQRHRVERMKGWSDLAEEDVTHARQALKEELARLDKFIAQYRAEMDAAKDAYVRLQTTRVKAAITEEQLHEAERRFHVAEAQFAQAEFEKRHREALGTREAIAGLDAESELARRQKDLADAQATLNLLEAGSRPEAIEAERARLARLEEELRRLEEQRRRQAIVCPVAGLVTTARLKEKVGQYLHEGDLICLIEEPASLEAEIALTEQDVARVAVGQEVELKARAQPFETYATKVDRIAPAAARGDIQSSVTIYCRLDHAPAELLPEMTGHARISTGRRPIGSILLDRAMRFVRTEFWW